LKKLVYTILIFAVVVIFGKYFFFPADSYFFNESISNVPLIGEENTLSDLFSGEGPFFSGIFQKSQNNVFAFSPFDELTFRALAKKLDVNISTYDNGYNFPYKVPYGFYYSGEKESILVFRYKGTSEQFERRLFVCSFVSGEREGSSCGMLYIHFL
jgi:hypothetical protein